MAGPLTYAPFEVVVVPFPYSDMLAEKRRPAVVVSRPEVEAEHGWLWLAMITSAPGPLRLGDVPLVDLASAGLGRTCRVRAAKLAALNSPRILKRAGALSARDRASLRAALSDCAAF